MYDLPLATHRHLIEPITKHQHVRKTLASRFLGFIDQIKKSPKLIPRMLLSQIQNDVRSTTGQNLRKLLLQTDKLNVEHLCKDDISIMKYHPTLQQDKWKEAMVSELLKTRNQEFEVDGFDKEELDAILEHLCVG